MTLHSEQTQSDNATQSLGSQLCVACGLCCRGVVVTYAYLLPNEVEKAKGLDLSVGQQEGRDTFDLPCKHHLDGKCSIYENRFHVCEAYQCTMLKRLLAKSISLEEALAIVRKTQELEKDIHQLLGTKDPTSGVWSALEDFFKANHVKNPNELLHSHPELLLKIRMLSIVGNKYFEPGLDALLNQNVRSLDAGQA